MFETDDQVNQSVRESGRDQTRERILDAAGQVFAKQGFAAATVREICRRAGANIAAINYHFGSKERLYAEVLRYADELSVSRNPQFVHAGGGAGGAMGAEVQLRFFIQQFLRRMFDSERPLWHDQLITREMMDPTPAMEELVERNIKPRAVMLQGIVRQLLGERAEDRDVQMCAASVVGQCMLYHRSKMMVQHLMPAIPLGDADVIGVLSEHIAKFSLDAIASRRRVLETGKPEQPVQEDRA